MPDPTPESIFAEFVAQRASAPDLDFEEWVKLYADMEAELRDLFDGDRLLRAARHKGLSFFKSTERARPGPAPGLEEGKVVGDFRLISLIGEGGMGQVWEAEQLSLGRTVALKFIRQDRVSERQLSYFEREARAGGRLSHPGIVAVFDFGESDGIAWIAMEMVEGCWTLRDFLDDALKLERLPDGYDRNVAAFVAHLALALQAAHDAGVIHRDLKPQNVLVTSEEMPKIADFGLARITGEVGVSQTGDFVGTYYYMSPEQVAAKRMGIDHRTDIFSLGVVMYEMLTLRRPFEGDTSQQVATKIVVSDPPDMRLIRSKVPADLAVICGKALEKDPSRRYATAGELAADVERHLKHVPILATPPTARDRIVKWTRRNPTRSVAAALGALAFIVVSALLVVNFQMRQSVGRTAVELLAKSTEIESRSYVSNVTTAGMLLDQDDPVRARELLEDCSLQRRQQWEWRWLDARQDCSLLVLEGHQGAVRSATFSPDGASIVTASADGTGRLWNSTSGNVIDVLAGHTGGILTAVFSSDGTRILTTSADSTARVWDSGSAACLAILAGHSGPVWTGAFDASGKHVLTSSFDGAVKLWDSQGEASLGVDTKFGAYGWPSLGVFSPDGLELATSSWGGLGFASYEVPTGRTLVEFVGEAFSAAAYNPDGSRILTASLYGSARVWDTVTGGEILQLEGHRDAITSVAYSPDGARIVTASSDRTAMVWDSRSGQIVARLEGHGRSVDDATFSPSGQRVLTSSRDGTARLWDARSSQCLAVLSGHRGEVFSARFSPDGTRAVTASADGTARLWDTATRQPSEPTARAWPTPSGHSALRLTVGDEVQVAVFSPDDSLVVTVTRSDTCRVWDAATGRPLTDLEGHGDDICAAEFSKDGTRLVTGSLDGTARIWDVLTGECLEDLAGHVGGVTGAVFSPDGQRIATMSLDGEARIWDAATFKLLHLLENRGIAINSVTFSKDGALLVTGAESGIAKVWDTDTGQGLADLVHSNAVLSASFDPDGTRVVTVTEGATAQIWSVETGENIAELSGHTGRIYSASFSHDGRQVVTASSDETARVWNATDGDTRFVLRGHRDRVTSAVFDETGAHVLTGADDRSARIWNAKTGECLADLNGHGGRLTSASFSCDGEKILTASADGSSRIWMAEPYAVRYRRLGDSHRASDRLSSRIAGVLQGGVDYVSVRQTLVADRSLTLVEVFAGIAAVHDLEHVEVGQYSDPPEIASRPRVGVVPIVVTLPDAPASAEIAEMARNQLMTLLVRSGRVKVVVKEHVDAALERWKEGPGTAQGSRDAGRANGVDYLIIGKISGLTVNVERRSRGFAPEEIGQVAGAGIDDYRKAYGLQKSDVMVTAEAAIDFRLVDVGTGMVAVANFSEARLRKSAAQIGVDILGLETTADAGRSLSDADYSRVLRLITDDALRKMILYLDDWLRDNH